MTTNGVTCTWSFLSCKPSWIRAMEDFVEVVDECCFSSSTSSLDDISYMYANEDDEN